MSRNIIFAILIVLLNTVYPVILFPYISRVFAVSTVGTYNYYNLIFAYLLIFSSFGINIYGSKEIGKFRDNKNYIEKVLSELFSINLINCFILFIVIILPIYLNTPEHERPIVLIFSLSVFASAFSMEWFYVGNENQQFVFLRNLMIKSLSLGAVFIFVKHSDDLLIYLTIVVGALITNAIINFYTIKKTVKLRISFNKIGWHYKLLLSVFCIEACFRYFGMGDIALIGKLISREDLGFLTFALSIYTISASFLKIIATTLLPRASYYLESGEDAKFENLLRSSFSFIFLFGLPACLMLFFLSDFIVLLLGGEKFLNSSILLKAFTPLLVISSIINVIVFQYLYPLKKTRNIIVIYIVGIIINIGANLLFDSLFGKFSFIICSTISHLLILIYFLLFENCWKFIKDDLVRYLLSFILGSMVTAALKYFVDINFWFFSPLSCGLGIMAYFGLLVLFKDPLLLNLLKRKK